MRTALDQDEIIYKLLNIPSVTGLISGKVYRRKRPSDSKVEDIVIGTLSTGDGSRQFGVTNVNIYAPDIALRIGQTDQYFPDSARLKLITDTVKPLLEETDGDDYVLWIESSEVVEEPEIKQHFVNLRIEVRMYNF